MKRISDSERLTLAMLRKTEDKLKEKQNLLDQKDLQIDLMVKLIHELKADRKKLCEQIHDLVHNKIANAKN